MQQNKIINFRRDRNLILQTYLYHQLWKGKVDISVHYPIPNCMQKDLYNIDRYPSFIPAIKATLLGLKMLSPAGSPNLRKTSVYHDFTVKFKCPFMI